MSYQNMDLGIKWIKLWEDISRDLISKGVDVNDIHVWNNKCFYLATAMEEGTKQYLAQLEDSVREKSAYIARQEAELEALYQRMDDEKEEA